MTNFEKWKYICGFGHIIEEILNGKLIYLCSENIKFIASFIQILGYRLQCALPSQLNEVIWEQRPTCRSAGLSEAFTRVDL